MGHNSLIALDVFKKETEKRVRELEDSIHKVLRRFEKDLDEMGTHFYIIGQKDIPQSQG
ncbi:MAG: hypothetical protein ACJ71P_07635 [Nitrososphaeraceae archaeon]